MSPSLLGAKLLPSSIMLRYHKILSSVLEKAVAQLGSNLNAEQIYGLLEKPQREEHGDIAFPCFQLAKTLKKAPPAIAGELAAVTRQLIDTNIFHTVEALGPYLNFRLSPEVSRTTLNEILSQGATFGRSQVGAGQKILIEYSSPNVAKEFHIGHFRNTILGQALNNLYSSLGYQTIAVNHLGDWGAQFGVVAYAYLNWGNAEELEQDAMAYLTKLYVRFHEEEEKNPEITKDARALLKKIEEGDPELKALWKKFRDMSVESLERTYKRLRVKFDHYLGESFYIDKVDGLIQELKQKNLLVESEGAQVVDLAPFDMPPCLVITGAGTTLYATRDLAAAIYRHDHFKFDRCLYVVGSEQILHFRQVFKVLELMGHAWAASLTHIHYGLYRFKDGKFSTRKGRVVLMADVLDEARDKALQLIEQKNPTLVNKEKVAEMIGLGAVIYNDLSTDLVKDVEFDFERILDFEGDTGPYLQYTHARACSILRQAKVQPATSLSAFPESLQNAPAVHALLKHIARFNQQVENSVRLNKPSNFANYALDLAKRFNGFYRQVKVLDDTATPEDVQARLAVVKAAQTALTNSLALLCMQAPEQM